MKAAITPLGDSAITVFLAEIASPENTARAREAGGILKDAGIPHVDEVLAAYTTVTVYYDSLRASFAEMSARIAEALEAPRRDNHSLPPSRLHRIPVVYDGADLSSVAAATGLTTNRVIDIHSSQAYTVDLLGFVPGFGYLSGLDARLELPRRSQPRQRVPAGSVAVASRLTCIYPFETPGGWHLLGTTDVVMFDARRAEPSLFKPGDTVRFERAR